MKIHFFLLESEVPDEMYLSWDPDSNPQMYSTGVGHNILELATRLRARNQRVTIGAQVAKDAEVVIFYKKHFLLERSRTLKILGTAAKFPTVLVRSDLPTEHTLIFRPDLEVVPNGILAERKNQKYLPHLPQRGLVARDSTRGNLLRNFEIKCYEHNIPDNLFEIASAIKKVHPETYLKIDSPKSSDSSDNNWHDFREVDISLILRSQKFKNIFSDDRKPATRLVNAWVAGTIPFVDPLPAYLEIIRDKVDGFVIYEVGDIEKTLIELMSNPEYLSEVREAVRIRSQEYQVDKILDDWENALREVSMKTKIGMARNLRLGFSFIKMYSLFKVTEILNHLKLRHF